jgi:hypothetical protein
MATQISDFDLIIATIRRTLRLVDSPATCSFHDFHTKRAW